MFETEHKLSTSHSCIDTENGYNFKPRQQKRTELFSTESMRTKNQNLNAFQQYCRNHSKLCSFYSYHIHFLLLLLHRTHALSVTLHFHVSLCFSADESCRRSLSVQKAHTSSLVDQLVDCHQLLRDFGRYGIIFTNVSVVTTVATVVLLRDFASYGIICVPVCARATVYIYIYIYIYRYGIIYPSPTVYVHPLLYNAAQLFFLVAWI
jgi:hypothetical protein